MTNMMAIEQWAYIVSNSVPFFLIHAYIGGNGNEMTPDFILNLGYF